MFKYVYHISHRTFEVVQKGFQVKAKSLFFSLFIVMLDGIVLIDIE